MASGCKTARCYFLKWDNFASSEPMRIRGNKFKSISTLFCNMKIGIYEVSLCLPAMSS